MYKAEQRTKSLEEIEEWVDAHIHKAKKLLNEAYKNDSGRSCEDYHKGCLETLIELKSYGFKVQNTTTNEVKEYQKGGEFLA
tara:strand:- start:91 stop:336 length:246 start_codon:yes stop_codon:yes gene_type:complete